MKFINVSDLDNLKIPTERAPFPIEWPFTSVAGKYILLIRKELRTFALENKNSL